jgi:LysR family transcriptional activator of mexEF-oprN operon
MDGLDLNLLVSLNALLKHQSVTRAAEETHLSQSAMSYNLARLRKALNDELFTRNAGGLVMTPYARTLVEPLSSIMVDISTLVTRTGSFDPAQAQRSFNIALVDAAEVLVIPEVLTRLSRDAPGIQLILRPLDQMNVLDALNTGAIDMAIGVFTDGQVHHKRKLLHSDEYLCIYNKRLLDLATPIALDDYLAASHVVAGSSARDVIGEELAKSDHRRRVALATQHLLSIPFIVLQSPVIATIHAGLARHFALMLDLETSLPPLSLPSVPISLLWHNSNDDDAAHRWMRSLVTESLRAARDFNSAARSS